MENALYIEINVVCASILLFLIYVNWRGVVREMEQIVFTNISIHSLLLFLLDVLWRVCNGRSFPGSHTLIELVSAAYFIQAALLGYSWLRYFFFLDPNHSMGRSLKRHAYAAPVYALALLNVFSIWTGWIFSVDANNVYHRGPLIWFQHLIGSTYLILPAIIAWVHSRSKRNYPNRKRLLLVSSMGLLAFVASVAQLLLPGLSVFCVGVTFGLLIIFMEDQHQRVSIDPLTRLNNRTQLRLFLDTKVAASSPGKHLVMFIMDLDYFKQINDKYGHMEGDKALITLSNVLKRILGPRGFYIARIGGDEFVTVAELRNFSDADKVIALLKDALAGESEKLPYDISLSVGFSEYCHGNDTIHEWFERADRELYKVKSQRHTTR